MSVYIVFDVETPLQQNAGGGSHAYIIYCDKTEDEIERFEKEQFG